MKKIMMMISLFLIGSCQLESNYSKLKEQMIYYQIKKRGIKDSLTLHALKQVDRHKFVPLSLRSKAYDDRPLPIGYGQTISQPYIVALMTEILELDKNSKVLEIGTGSGYQAAILAEIVDHVYTIEIVEPLAKQSIELFGRLNYENISAKYGDGYLGWPDHQPFDAIIVTCSPSHIPQPLQDQLAEGGRMIIPVGTGLNQELVLVTKENGEIKQKSIIPVRFVPMTKRSGRSY